VTAVDPSTDTSAPVSDNIRFADLNLHPAVLQALSDVGYESPSPIQAQTIPPLLSGRDVLGQAQTGTGKTAAFALPILCKLDLAGKTPQALVLTPTRELAIQVAEAFQKYATHMKGFHVLPIYGGQSYTPQLMSLRRGVQVVVGTPGRVMDHIKRGTLNLAGITNLVLDEADEMLRMGFIDDVEWILEHVPSERQVALFSATMPNQVRRIAQTHLKDPSEITIRSKTRTADNIRQRYWMVSGMHKLDALTRILEAEPFDAMLIFARTKQATIELTEKLEARGFAVEALNGDIPQNVRERTVTRLKSGQIDIVVATDVAARGLDVDRVSHVVNYDVPYDSESYVHRIGRTGRAGRSGEAILFIAPRERNMLRVIERATRQPIEQMQVPSVQAVNEHRIAKFKERIARALADGAADRFRFVVEQFEMESNVSTLDIAAALVSIAQGRTPLLLDPAKHSDDKGWASQSSESRARRDVAATTREIERSAEHKSKGSERKLDRGGMKSPSLQAPVQTTAPDVGDEDDAALPSLFDDETQPESPRRSSRDERDDIKRETFRIEVGHMHGVKPGNIVGAIANEAGLEGRYIGRVDIRDDHSFVDLPTGMPKQIFRDLQKARVAGQELRISRADAPRPQHAHFKSSKGRRDQTERPHHAHKARSSHRTHAPSRPHGAKHSGRKRTT